MSKAITFIALLFCCAVNAQLKTYNFLSPDDLVKSFFIGEGVTFSNVTYKGHSQAIGRFNGVQSNIGVSCGIIMSTGDVLDNDDPLRGKNGPVGPNNNYGASKNWYSNNPKYGDSDLSNLISDSTYDAAVLEFDFIPQGDTVEFEYVFASEEYPEFADHYYGFNDVLGLFISGSGITGLKNMAVVPDDTSTNVSIHSINSISRANLYIENGNGHDTLEVQYSDPTVVNFNGFTVPLKAVSKVTPGESYHMKLAIADGGDGSYDSGVFFKAGSFKSSDYPVDFDCDVTIESIQNPLLSNKFIVYPNPLEKGQMAKIDKDGMNINYTILDIQGKVIFSEENSSKDYILTSELKSGIYLIRIESLSSKSTTTTRLVIK